MMNDDEIDRRLRTAGERARDLRPDTVEAQRAYRARRGGNVPKTTQRRNWWPTLIGAGLVGVAVLGLVVYGPGRSTDTVNPPVDTAPGPVTTSQDDDAPDDDTATTVGPAGTSPCEPTIDAGDGRELVVVNCRDTGEAPAALIAEVPTGGDVADATRWFVTFEPLTAEPVELYFSAAVEGIDNTISFLREFDSGLNCVVLVEQTSGGEWKEACWLDSPVTQAVAEWDGSIVQFDLTKPRAVLAHPLDSVGSWASSGCSANDLRNLITTAGDRASLFTSVGCVGERAAVREEWVRMQPGPSEGTHLTFAHDDETWELLDTETTSASDYAFGIPEYQLWTSRTTADPVAAPYDVESINNRPVEERNHTAALATLAADLIFEDTGVRLNGWMEDPAAMLLEIPVVTADNPTSIIGWHFIHYTGSDEAGYQIVAWFQADA